MDAETRCCLLEDARIRLDVTWTDENTDRKLLQLLDDAAAYLDDKLGTPGDYISPGLPRTLLFEHMRYARDAALDVFENNYQSLILAMQNNRKAASYEVEETGQA